MGSSMLLNCSTVWVYLSVLSNDGRPICWRNRWHLQKQILVHHHYSVCKALWMHLQTSFLRLLVPSFASELFTQDNLCDFGPIWNDHRQWDSDPSSCTITYSIDSNGLNGSRELVGERSGWLGGILQQVLHRLGSAGWTQIPSYLGGRTVKCDALLDEDWERWSPWIWCWLHLRWKNLPCGTSRVEGWAGRKWQLVQVNLASLTPFHVTALTISKEALLNAIILTSRQSVKLALLELVEEDKGALL